MKYDEATMIPRKDKNNYWYAYVTVPQPLRLILNKKQLLKSLGTTDRRIAKSRLREAEAELYQKLNEADSANHPLVKSAVALQEVVYGSELKFSATDWFDPEIRFKAHRQLTDDALDFINDSLKNIDPALPKIEFNSTLFNEPLLKDIEIELGLDPNNLKITTRKDDHITSSEVFRDKILPTLDNTIDFLKTDLLPAIDSNQFKPDPNILEFFNRKDKKSKQVQEALLLYKNFEKAFSDDSVQQYTPMKRARTLASVIDEFLKSTTFKEIERKNPATASEYESKIKLFSKWAGNITLDDITHKLGNDFVDDLISSDSTIVDGGVANSTLVKYMSAIKSVWQYCLDQEIVPEKLWGNIKTKGKGKAPSDRRSMSKDELTKFFSINHNQEDRLFLTCLATTGARFEEFAQAKWKHIKTWEDGTMYIDLKMGEVGFSDGNDLRLKNRKSKRHIPLLKQVEELLPERQDDEQKVFSYTTNSKGKHDALNKRLNRLIRREVTKDKQVVLHSLRHSFKTLFRETSNDYELGEFILGHQGVGNVSSSYGEAHSIPDKKKAMEQMDFGFLNTPRLTDERKTTEEN